MKKLIILITILCLLGVTVAACSGSQTPAETEAPADEVVAEPEAAEEEKSTGVDLEALYALHDPDEVVMTIDGVEIPWRDYYYFYQGQILQMEQQFQMYQSYGMALGWNSPGDDEGHTYAELMGPEIGTDTENNLRQLVAIETLVKEQDIQLSKEEQDQMQQEHQQTITRVFGEEGTEEQLYEYLESIHATPELYWRINSYSFLYNACFNKLYGENGEKLEEQETLDWMKEQGILSANHILISTSGLEEDAKAEKAALAKQIAEELQAIEDAEERAARFLELQEQYGEDPGTVNGGYVFGPGLMVQEFYDGAMALEEDQISDPVETEFGYHIILRRPLHADDKINSSSGANYSGRVWAASDRFTNMLDERMANQKVVYAKGFATPDLTAFLPKTDATE